KLACLVGDDVFTRDKFQMDVPNCSGWVSFPWLATKAPEGQRTWQEKDKLMNHQNLSSHQQMCFSQLC
ncbi:hypothetical protein OS493_038469, partial [Desmophyllum pertusum]